MAKEVLELSVKSNIKSVTKEQKDFNKELKNTSKEIKDVNVEGKETVREMQILGVSLKGLQASWKTAASGAKFLFRTVKAGIISTGIGIFVVALGTVATFFAKTKKGAEILKIALAGLGAAVGVVVDRVAKFGGGLLKLLTGSEGGLKDMKDSFKGIGKEIVTDTLYTMALTKATQKLADSQRALNVETAQQRAEIERLKLIAEDVTKSEQERLKAAQDAFAIENKLLNKRVSNAKEAVRLETERQKTITKQAEDLDKLAQLEIDLANIKAESTTKQIELNNKINAIEAEAAAKRLEALNQLKEADKEKQALIDAEFEAKIKANDEWNKEQQRIAAEEIELAKKVAAEKKKLDEEQAAEDKRIADGKKQMNIDIANQGLQILGDAAGEGTAIAKGAAIAQATIAGTQSVINAFNAANANVGLTAATAGAYPITMAGLAATFAAMNISKIASGGKPSASGGGGGGAAPQTPAPQMMSGAFELGGGLTPEPMKAFVVTDEMSNSQNQLANIRRTATI